jgi:hypothetical protein
MSAGAGCLFWHSKRIVFPCRRKTMARSRHIKGRVQPCQWPYSNFALPGYGREQRPPAWNSVVLPQRTCFRRRPGHDTLWLRATRSRPDFIRRSAGTGIASRFRSREAQVADSGSKAGLHRARRPADVSPARATRYRGDMKLSCDCYNRRLLASAGAASNGAKRPSSEQEQAP